MRPQIQLFNARTLAFRTRSSHPRKRLAPAQYSHDAKTARLSPEPKGPNQDQLPHVSEEQAALDKSMGNTPPDLSQGTPVQEILEREPDAMANAPEVMKKGFEKTNTPSSQSRQYSTSTRRLAEEVELTPTRVENLPPRLEYPKAGPGHKFGLPDLQNMPRSEHFKKRYDPVVDQVTKSIMKSGKLSQAQRNMEIILDTLRSTPSPQISSANPLLASNIPASALPLSPVQYLTAAIDSVAPLVKIRQQRGIAGGGASLPIPVPLGLRQRRRQAIQWILKSADSRTDVRLADRVAKEIINVANGKGGAWEKRSLAHKMGISARSNVRLALMGPRRKR